MKNNEVMNISRVLKRGKENAISSNNLQIIFGISERELYNQIEKERLNGIPILAKKSEGGGYYLPSTLEEIDTYLNLVRRTIDSYQSIYQAIEEYKKSSIETNIL